MQRIFEANAYPLPRRDFENEDEAKKYEGPAAPFFI